MQYRNWVDDYRDVVKSGVSTVTSLSARKQLISGGKHRRGPYAVSNDHLLSELSNQIRRIERDIRLLKREMGKKRRSLSRSLSTVLDFTGGLTVQRQERINPSERTMTNVENGDMSGTGSGSKPTEADRTSFESRIPQLNLITQATRAKLIQNIIGHRWMMPSKLELERYNPSKTGGTLTQHLEKLIDADIVMRVSIPSGERSRSGPSSFFVLTDEGCELLEEHRMFIPIKEEIRQDHAEVPKPEKVKQYELAKRPTVDVEYDHPLAGEEEEVVDPLDYAGDYDELGWDENTTKDNIQDDDHREAIM